MYMFMQMTHLILPENGHKYCWNICCQPKKMKIQKLMSFLDKLKALPVISVGFYQHIGRNKEYLPDALNLG
jgi:hypothetical protein